VNFCGGTEKNQGTLRILSVLAGNMNENVWNTGQNMTVGDTLLRKKKVEDMIGEACRQNEGNYNYISCKQKLGREKLSWKSGLG
jgi:hypothetical protein